MLEDDKKPWVEYIEEQGRRPLSYRDLISSSNDAHEHEVAREDRFVKAENPPHGEGFNVSAKRGSENESTGRSNIA